MKVFVHLAHGMDSEKWEKNWLAGKLIGLNDRFPYGYNRAESYGCKVIYSVGHTEGAFVKIFRLGIRALLGFDFIHALRNRHVMLSSHVVWTHTESQYLAVLLLLKVFRGYTRPKVIAQTVWLIDDWPRIGNLRKYIYRWLINDADLMTYHSPLNKDRAEKIFPRKRSELVLFGISSDYKFKSRSSLSSDNIRVLALGNDRHRDWACLLEAFGNRERYHLKIGTKSLSENLKNVYSNVNIMRAKSNDDLIALYEWADFVVVSVKQNLHASGITVILEAAHAGRPIVCTRAGGLDNYFNDDEVIFVEPSDPEKLRAAVDSVCKDQLRIEEIVTRARSRIKASNLTSEGFALRHVVLSRQLLPEVDT